MESAIANAEHNDGVDIDDLFVEKIFVERGTKLKRFAACAKGRGVRIEKPTCHIFISVARKGNKGLRQLWDKKYNQLASDFQ